MKNEIIQRIEKLDRAANKTFGDAYEIAEMFHDIPEEDQSESIALSKIQSIVDRYYTLDYVKKLDGGVLSAESLKMMSFASCIERLDIKRTWTNDNVTLDGQRKMITIQIYVAVLVDFTECIFCNILVC